MAGPENEHIYGVQLRESANDGSDFTNADTDYRKLFLGEDGLLHVKDSAGAVTSPYSTTGTPAFAGALLHKNATQSIANATSVALTWQTDTIDTDAFHDTGSNTERATIPSGKAGKYRATMAVAFATNATGLRYVYIYKNGIAGTLLATRDGDALTGDTTRLEISVIVDLIVGDYLVGAVYQDSGGALNVESATYLSTFMLEYLGS
jgi:hypothetical protein